MTLAWMQATGLPRFIPCDWCCSVESVSDPELELSVSLASEISAPIEAVLFSKYTYNTVTIIIYYCQSHQTLIFIVTILSLEIPLKC